MGSASAGTAPIPTRRPPSEASSRTGTTPPRARGEVVGGGWCGAQTDTPAVFRSIEPAWNDRNLREVAGHVESPLFLAHIRASTGTAVQQPHCHPLRHGPWLRGPNR